MQLLASTNILYEVLFACFLYATYIAHWQLTIGTSRRRMIAKQECKPIDKTDEWGFLNDSIFGWRSVTERAAAARSHKLLSWAQKRHRRYGNTLTTRYLTTDLISTIEPENVKAILATNFEDWALPDRRKNAFDPLMGSGIFTTDGPAWRHSRQLLRPNFDRSQVGNLEMQETHVEHLIEAIPKDGSTIDLQPLFFRLTLDSATEMLFGESTDSLLYNHASTKPRQDDFAECYDRALGQIAKASIHGPLLALFFRGSGWKADVKVVHGLVDRYVQNGFATHESHGKGGETSQSEDRYIFLKELIKSNIDPVRIRSELMNILVAGRDTTASLLSSTWFVLARRPDIWTKLRTEVDELDGKLPTLEQVRELKYLKAVINESLRLYPPVPGNARMAVKDTVLPLGGGSDGQSPIFIPARTIVQYTVYNMHRRQDLYGADADEFRPERWKHLHPKWEFLPFNGGPRVCLGQQLALTEASYTTVRLMQAFKSIESRDPGPWQERLSLTCSVLNGVRVSLGPSE